MSNAHASDLNTDNLLRPIKICRVCGDVALGFNFNGLSCESCKAFFRRNVPKENNFECRNSNNCLIEKSTRKYCKRCRMDKCLTIGMKKELITIFKERSTLANIPENISEYNVELQPYDLKQMHHIEVAMDHFANEHSLPLAGQSDDLLRLANLNEHFIRRVIKYCKSVESFRCLKDDDQLQVIKSFYPEMVVIQMSFIYIEEKDGLRLVNETGQETIFAKMEITKDLASKGYGRTFRKFALPLLVLMENDPTIRNLIFSQLLFKPRNNTKCKEFIKYNYWLYSHLLRKYLRFKFKHTGEQKFSSLMDVMGQIGEPARMFANMYKHEFEPNELHELVRNIYDI